MGNKKFPQPNEGSKSRFLYKGLSSVYPTRSRMKSTTSGGVKTAPRNFVTDVSDNVNLTSKEMSEQVKSLPSPGVVGDILDIASFFH
jgi:hypothetical protein